jgi:hypothetical protein
MHHLLIILLMIVGLRVYIEDFIEIVTFWGVLGLGFFGIFYYNGLLGLYMFFYFLFVLGKQGREGKYCIIVVGVVRMQESS